MDKVTVLERIDQERPRVVYLSGKTCSGKTTFAHELVEYGYKRIGLDPIVMHSVYETFQTERSEAFIAAYRGEISNPQTQAFIDAARANISETILTKPVVVEGAIASAAILKAILATDLNDSFLFVYFHPRDLEEYARRITARFTAGIKDDDTGLPKGFWELVDQNDVDHYLEHEEITASLRDSIATFAKRSATESAKRLKHFQEHFSDISVVEF